MVVQSIGVRSQNKFLSKVYLWMALALVISGVTAYAVAASIYNQGAGSLFYRLIFGNSVGYIVLAFVEVGVAWWLTLCIRKISVAAATIGYIFYSVLNGLTISSIFLIYTKQSIFTIFFISALMFAVMAIYGMTTKTSLVSYGKYFTMAMIGLVIAMVVNLLLRSSTINMITSIVTVVLFTGLTAYDTQKLTRASEVAGGVAEETLSKASIIGALELYLDFINIFLALLRLFGQRKD